MAAQGLTDIHSSLFFLYYKWDQGLLFQMKNYITLLPLQLNVISGV